MKSRRARCEQCGEFLKRRTHGQLVDLLTRLYAELNTRPVTLTLDHEDSYRNGRASELITMTLREETARFCLRHTPRDHP